MQPAELNTVALPDFEDIQNCKMVHGDPSCLGATLIVIIPGPQACFPLPIMLSCRPTSLIIESRLTPSNDDAIKDY